MARPEKWLSGVSLDDPVDQVARRALEVRLGAVEKLLDEAVGGRDQAEGVHQLRIATRRAAAALGLFAPLIPKPRLKAVRKSLRKIRRTAGEVRDCDVHLARLAQSEDNVPKSLVRRIGKQRSKARRALKALFRRLRKRRRFAACSELLLESLQWPKRHSSSAAASFGPWCRQRLAPLANEFLAASAGDLNNDERLHELRIAGKRLRYALELAAAVVPPPVHQRLYETMSTLQDRLGEVCDHLAAVRRLRELIAKSGKSAREKLRRMLNREEAALADSRRRAMRWWSPARQQRLNERLESVIGADIRPETN